MSENKSNRREFLTKLGLVVGAATLSATGVSGINRVTNSEENQFNLTPDQSKFMVVYEKWLTEFHDMAKFQKQDSKHLENNKKLMALSAEAEKWQKQLHVFMEDENFAAYQKMITEKVTATI
jgi:hypothetical protein